MAMTQDMPLFDTTAALPPPSEKPVLQSPNDPLGIQPAYTFLAVDESDVAVSQGEFGMDPSISLRIPPQSIQIQRSLRSEVLKDVTSGISIVSGGEGIGRITIGGTHGVGENRDTTYATDGRTWREMLIAFFAQWVAVNEARGRDGRPLLRLVFQMVGGGWSNPWNEQYFVWPESFPSDSRSAGRPHSWEYQISLLLLSPRVFVAASDSASLLSPENAITKLSAMEEQLQGIIDAYRRSKVVLQNLRDLKTKLAQVRNRVQGFVDSARNEVYEVTDLVRGSAQLCSNILTACDPKAFLDDTTNAIRGSIYEVRRLLGRVSMTATQYSRTGSSPASLTAPRSSGLSRPLTVSVVPGDSLQRIAARHLGDSSRWIDLVTTNNLEFPFFDFSGPNGRPGIAYAGLRVFGATDTLKLPLTQARGVVGVADDPIGKDIPESGDQANFLVGGKDNLVAALLRRLRTPRGRIPWHPLYGSGLKLKIGTPQTMNSIIDVRNEVVQCLKADSRVLDLRNVSAQAFSGGVLTRAEAITPLGPVLISGTSGTTNP
jgi:phage baseplate assembly protein W